MVEFKGLCVEGLVTEDTSRDPLNSKRTQDFSRKATCILLVPPSV